MGNSVPECVVNRLLTGLGGLEDAGSVIVIATTNRPDMADSTPIRSGRFDHLMLIGQSEKEGHG